MDDPDWNPPFKPSIEPSMQHFFDSLDDVEKCWRYFVLSSGDAIVCSHLLTRREAVKRSHQASKRCRPLVVSEKMLEKYRELKPGAPVRASTFTSHSELGAIGMFWELLARSWDRRRTKEKEQAHE